MPRLDGDFLFCWTAMTGSWNFVGAALEGGFGAAREGGSSEPPGKAAAGGWIGGNAVRPWRQLREAHERDTEIEADEGVHFQRAWLDPDSGKVFCLASGPSREAVMRIHERAGHPTADVYEVPIEVA